MNSVCSGSLCTMLFPLNNVIKKKNKNKSKKDFINQICQRDPLWHKNNDHTTGAPIGTLGASLTTSTHLFFHCLHFLVLCHIPKVVFFCIYESLSTCQQILPRLHSVLLNSCKQQSLNAHISSLQTTFQAQNIKCIKRYL